MDLSIPRILYQTGIVSDPADAQRQIVMPRQEDPGGSFGIFQGDDVSLGLKIEHIVQSLQAFAVQGLLCNAPSAQVPVTMFLEGQFHLPFLPELVFSQIGAGRHLCPRSDVFQLMIALVFLRSAS